MFARERERERLRSAREKKKKKKNDKKEALKRKEIDSRACLLSTLPRAREKDASDARKSERENQKERAETETIKRTVRVSLCPARRRRRRLSGGGSAMRAVVVVVVAILQRREKIHRRLLGFGGHRVTRKTNLRDGCSRASGAKKRRGKWRFSRTRDEWVPF